MIFEYIHAKIDLMKRIMMYAHNLTVKETVAHINRDYLKINLPCGKRVHIPKSEKGNIYALYNILIIVSIKVNRSVVRLVVKFSVESKIMIFKLMNVFHTKRPSV
uniref:Uncharacterized protein n=1 Tax=Ditylum brightwellii TaxID=49249 RepID=A0A7S4RMP0_9STRA